MMMTEQEAGGLSLSALQRLGHDCLQTRTVSLQCLPRARCWPEPIGTSPSGQVWAQLLSSRKAQLCRICKLPGGPLATPSSLLSLLQWLWQCQVPTHTCDTYRNICPSTPMSWRATTTIVRNPLFKYKKKKSDLKKRHIPF